MRKISFKATGAAMIAAIDTYRKFHKQFRVMRDLHFPFIGGNSNSAVEDRNWIPCLEEV